MSRFQNCGISSMHGKVIAGIFWYARCSENAFSLAGTYIRLILVSKESCHQFFWWGCCAFQCLHFRQTLNNCSLQGHGNVMGKATPAGFLTAVLLLLPSKWELLYQRRLLIAKYVDFPNAFFLSSNKPALKWINLLLSQRWELVSCRRKHCSRYSMDGLSPEHWQTLYRIFTIYHSLQNWCRCKFKMKQFLM